MLEQADIFAARLRREAGAKVDSQIRRAYWLTVGRAPEKPDIAASESLISSEGLPAFCRALLNANEFVYVF
jgi:hypothetical protein